MDSIDQAILRELQQDCSRSVQEIGAAVGLSQSPCWKRIRRLEEAGVLQGRVALVDPAKVGLNVTVFVTIRTNQHNEAWLDRFGTAVASIPEVIEIYRMSGDVDYLLKILAADIDDYDRIYKKLIRSVEMFDVSSSFAMEQLKYTTAVPLGEEA
ncbi:MAG: Lrp/AsnC family transcriptional regulator [Myxococcota bacterium]|nr:Lrp/AsnC family transcriptional regulator [Myxococcota bacterium]